MSIRPDGTRQIFTFFIPGDIISSGFNKSGRELVALTRLQVGDAAVSDDDGNAEQLQTNIVDAAARTEARILNHITRLGSLTARERVLNLLLEFHDRLSAVGLTTNGAYRLPITQQMFADALGLSHVHINRTLHQLRRDNMIAIERAVITLHNRQRLAALACYDVASSAPSLPSAVG
jgi:CRP-like cAMP-binding protein